MTHTNSNILDVLRANELDNQSLWAKRINEITPQQVEKAIAEKPGVYRLDKLCALLSPAAENYLEQMAQKAKALTLQRFGSTVKLYAPLYLSNYCSNNCRYCGFNQDNSMPRTRLTVDQAVKEAEIIAAEGFRDLLLVSGEDRKFITVDYLSELAHRLRDKFSTISIEIFQLSRDEYEALFRAGIEGVTLYQETYDRQCYEYYHPRGQKSSYEQRLTAPDDFAAAGMRQIGLAFLLGLKDWRTETLALAQHGDYLMKKYWQSQISFSFPRIRPACEVEREKFDHLVSDKELVQMILALRLCFADAGLVLSTRESIQFRDNMAGLAITRMSAGSKTNPGGYSGQNQGEQFKIDDDRTANEIAEMLRKKHLDPIWKDWDKGFLQIP